MRIRWCSTPITSMSPMPLYAGENHTPPPPWCSTRRLLPFVVRRRGRFSALALVVLMTVSIILLRGFAGDISYPSGVARADSLTARFLELVFPWPPKAKPSQHPLVDARNATDVEQEGDGADGGKGTPAKPKPNLDDKVLPGHIWGTDGLLVVNPNGAHPIYELIRHAEAQWAEKHARASTTLEEAVAEYERRYRRPPPAGFDLWWDYVAAHDVQLPDEYDQIHADLEPFWGIDPVTLNEARAALEGQRDTFTLGKASYADILMVLNMSLPEDRAADFLRWGAKPHMDLMSGVYEHLPPFRAVVSPHDGPSQLVDWTWRAAALEAARKGSYLQPDDLPPHTGSGFHFACPPDSPLRLSPILFDEDPAPRELKSLIHDHRRAMDPCVHPQHLLLHTEFLKGYQFPMPQRWPTPLLSNCATSLHADIRTISLSGMDEFAVDDQRWGDKSDDRLLWRGSPTGMMHKPGVRWQWTQRVRLVNATRSNIVDAADEAAAHTDVVTVLPPTENEHEPVGRGRDWLRRRLNDALMDTAFAGTMPGCEDEVCDEMERYFPRRHWMGMKEAGEYKYVVDVDGNGWSGRFRKLMSMNAVVFKATIYPEWWLDRVQPWVHYVPAQLDYSDLHDVLMFFGGDPSGGGAHDELARRIALAGRDWVERYWRREDAAAYMFRLWLEYARVMNANRDTEHFRLPS